MKRRFVTLDVFTTEPHAGNPLAVVLDADGLDTAAMQAIAREFNLSETVFVAPPADAGPPRRDPHLHARPRIALRRPSDRRNRRPAGAARRRGGQGRRMSSCWRRRSGSCPAPSPCSGARAGHAVFTLAAPAGARSSSPAALAADRRRRSGSTSARSASTRHVPSVFSAGVAFTFVPVASLEAMERVTPRHEPVVAGDEAGRPAQRLRLLPADPRCRPSLPCPDVRARAWGSAEDPATGSARRGLRRRDHALRPARRWRAPAS